MIRCSRRCVPVRRVSCSVRSQDGLEAAQPRGDVADFTPTQKYPAVIRSTAVRRRVGRSRHWRWNAQMFAGRATVVPLMANPRGSEGFGQNVPRSGVGRLGRRRMTTSAKSSTSLRSSCTPIRNARRRQRGYGGCMVNWIGWVTLIALPRWSAHVGVYDPRSMAGETGRAAVSPRFGAIRRRDNHTTNSSPSRYADKFQNPDAGDRGRARLSRADGTRLQFLPRYSIAKCRRGCWLFWVKITVKNRCTAGFGMW